ncbi:2-octaprenyl-6-methoxyphenyl hydroxylase [Vibrio sp. SS-MA-C1-2]|uniref:2-octaprenyl-6-methoxyphenyl hydroxylase n=1 Tax=Vibrio sp. SS-MA-C1-2 TaxID=2908646 RepID=UPI001F272D05|nr:2-octaprenyl-6-methoxyphenyl hydroxylase [Vibrio sp. SS-MA-C1-2]UJF19043.1 2-octaprenyl-6-methoxyphenyl hydroxylase [Vibrio sp. SS-MA-C1-2]
MSSFDIIISGGAMAGASLALALDKLSQGRLTIAVIEANAYDKHMLAGFDSRSIALSYGSIKLLKRVGLWGELDPFATPIQDIDITDRHHLGHVTISAQDQGVDSLGSVIELHDVGRVCVNQLTASDKISLFCPDRVETITRDNTSTTVTLYSGQQLKSRLFVAADGAYSQTTQQLGMTRSSYDFGQVAVIANIETELPHQGQAFERFTTHGPVALLPMSQQRSSLVWCFPPEQAEKVMSWSDEAFLNQLQKTFGWRLGKLKKTGRRDAYPLFLNTNQSTITHRAVAIGNAAQALHPIAGQGFNLGLRDVTDLADVIVEALNQQQDIGCHQTLRQYRECRQRDKEVTINGTSGLVHLFANNYWPLVVGRNLGLMAMESCSTLKQPLIKQAMGLVSS